MHGHRSAFLHIVPLSLNMTLKCGRRAMVLHRFYSPLYSSRSSGARSRKTFLPTSLSLRLLTIYLFLLTLPPLPLWSGTLTWFHSLHDWLPVGCLLYSLCFFFGRVKGRLYILFWREWKIGGKKLGFQSNPIFSPFSSLFNISVLSPKNIPLSYLIWSSKKYFGLNPDLLQFPVYI